MLQITISPGELWDEANNEFIVSSKSETIQLEHSLLSLSKWEARWCVPFLSKTERTREELNDYVRCMTIAHNLDPSIYSFLTDSNIREITEYINAPMTATTLPPEKKGQLMREQITSELIYYWMVALGIPFECQKWHLNRLITLIRVCDKKNQAPNKRSTNEIMRSNAALNAARKKAWNTRG